MMVAVVRPAAPGPIVLGTDFGPVSAAAERAAIRVAAQRGADLVIVHAIDTGTLRLPGGRWRERVGLPQGATPAGYRRCGRSIQAESAGRSI